MKDIYEILNDADLDFKDVKDIEVNELERKRGKRKLMSSIKKKNNFKKKSVIAASICVLAAVSIVTANPVLAKNIPIIGDLIQRELVSVNSNYEDYTNVIGQTTTYNGLEITFESAVVDNTSLFLSYTIKDNDNIIKDDSDIYTKLMGISINVNGEEINSYGGSYKIEQSEENTYSVLEIVDLNYEELPSTMNIQLVDTNSNMNIKFTAKTEDIKNETTVIEINKSIDLNGKECFVESISVSPLVVQLNYYVENSENEDLYDVVLFDILDQDGNKLQDSTGRSTTIGCEDYVDGRNDYAINYISEEYMETLKLVPVIDRDNREEFLDKAIIVDLK